MVSAKAYSPGGITSFFQPYELELTNKSLPSGTHLAARGGGFTIKRGITTFVTASRSKKNKIDVFVNKRPVYDFHTTESVARFLIDQTNRKYSIRIEHNIKIPIGSGYGASAAGALSTALAMNELLRIGLTFDELGAYAHKAEIKCRTGLGTVGPLMIGGCILQKEGGPPGLCKIDRIPLKPSYMIISGCYGPILTRNVLKSKIVTDRISKEGGRVMKSILSNPNLMNFFDQAEKFSFRVGFMTKKVEKLIESVKAVGAVGGAQNMLGESFHAVVEEDQVKNVLKILREITAGVILFSSKIESQGARLL